MRDGRDARMADLSDVHHIVIGYDKIEEYKININILRNAFVKGKDLLITAVYNGDHPNLIPSRHGRTAHVDNFVVLEENKGYVWGAIDAIEKGLSFANSLKDKRKIVLLTNFDGLFFSEERYNWLIDDFIESDKPFGAGIPCLHKYPLSDLMIFRSEFLPRFSEGLEKVMPTYAAQLGCPSPENLKGSSAFANWTCEEHIRDALKAVGEIDNLWWKFERDTEEAGGRRYTFHNEYAFGHLHGDSQIEVKMNKYDIHNILKGDKKMTEVDETIKRTRTTPQAKEVEKTQSFTAAFASDAHAEANRAFEGSEVEIVSIDESSAGDAGTTVTVTFK